MFVFISSLLALGALGSQKVDQETESNLATRLAGSGSSLNAQTSNATTSGRRRRDDTGDLYVDCNSEDGRAAECELTARFFGMKMAQKRDDVWPTDWHWDSGKMSPDKLKQYVRGCYFYTEGKFKNHAFYGREGAEGKITDPSGAEGKMRVPNRCTKASDYPDENIGYEWNGVLYQCSINAWTVNEKFRQEQCRVQAIVGANSEAGTYGRFVFGRGTWGVSSPTGKHKYEKFEGSCVWGSDIAKHTGVRDAKQCAHYCDVEPRCKGFEFGSTKFRPDPDRVTSGGALKPGDCQLNSSADMQGGGDGGNRCDGRFDYNIDFYVKRSLFSPGWAFSNRYYREATDASHERKAAAYVKGCYAYIGGSYAGQAFYGDYRGKGKLQPNYKVALPIPCQKYGQSCEAWKNEGCGYRAGCERYRC